MARSCNSSRLPNSSRLQIYRRPQTIHIQSVHSCTLKSTACFSNPLLELKSMQLRRLSTASEARKFKSQRSEDVFQKLIQLDIADVRLITEMVAQKLGAKITHADRMGKSAAASSSNANSAATASEAEVSKVEEKTIFDVKLVSFDEKSKIKVIKEIRAVTGLGLKEAKDLVEGAPKVIKKGLKKEEAQELKAKLEASGAVIEVA